MLPVETEYYDLVRHTITPPPRTRLLSDPKFLTWFSTHAQLGVNVDCKETELKKAYRKAAMKVPYFNPLKRHDSNRLTRTLTRFRPYVTVPSGQKRVTRSRGKVQGDKVRPALPKE